jgi:hypothetical protein
MPTSELRVRSPHSSNSYHLSSITLGRTTIVDRLLSRSLSRAQARPLFSCFPFIFLPFYCDISARRCYVQRDQLGLVFSYPEPLCFTYAHMFSVSNRPHLEPIVYFSPTPTFALTFFDWDIFDSFSLGTGSGMYKRSLVSFE